MKEEKAVAAREVLLIGKRGWAALRKKAISSCVQQIKMVAGEQIQARRVCHGCEVPTRLYRALNARIGIWIRGLVRVFEQ